MTKLIQQHESLKEATAIALQEAETFSGLASDVLTNVVIETIRKYQQKLNVGIADSVSDLLDTFKKNVSRSIFDTASGWRITNRDNFLFPQGCRFCFSSADNTIVVIEQPAQIRALLLDNRLFGDSYLDTNDCGGAWTSLSLPYVVFVLHFKNNEFRNLYCGWRTSPLSALTDSLSRPVLPNIRECLSVCIGKSSVQGECISQISESVIGNFWNSMFNNDISDYWWSKRNIDSRLRLGTWKALSEVDPTFILNVKFPETDRSIKSVIDLITKHDVEPDETVMRHELSEVIDKTSELLFSKIMNYIRNTKFDKYYPKDVSEALMKSMKEASSEFADIVFALRDEIESMKNEIENQKSATCEPCGRLWSNY